MGSGTALETCTAQFVTSGGVRYAIWASTDETNDLACTIRIEPVGFEGLIRRADTLCEENAQKECERSSSDLEVLTAREREVAYLVADGATNQEIAEELCISLSTVKSHLQRIFDKLAVGNRSMLVRRYFETSGMLRAS